MFPCGLQDTKRIQTRFFSFLEAVEKKLYNTLQPEVTNGPRCIFNLFQDKIHSMLVYRVARHHKHFWQQQTGGSDTRSVLMGVGWIEGDLLSVEFRGGPPW